jgi:hypothetical protein
MEFRSSSCSDWSLSAILIMTLTSIASASSAEDWQSRVTPQVQLIWQSARTPAPNASPSTGVTASAAARPGNSNARYDSKGRLQMDVAFDCSQPAPSAALTTAGMIIGTTVKAPPMCVVESWAAVSSIPASAADVPRDDLHQSPRPPRIRSYTAPCPESHS